MFLSPLEELALLGVFILATGVIMAVVTIIIVDLMV